MYIHTHIIYIYIYISPHTNIWRTHMYIHIYKEFKIDIYISIINRYMCIINLLNFFNNNYF